MTSEIGHWVADTGRAPRRDDVVLVRIEGVTSNGRGLAHFDTLVGPQQEPRRYRCEVRKAMPGDVVEAIIEARKRKTFECRIGRVVEPSPARRQPRCQHFGPREEPGRGCGGCTLQALDETAQLTAKKALVERLLGRGVRDPVAAAEPWFYRNKMEFTFGDDRHRNFGLGLRPTGWHREVIALRECFLMDPDTVKVAEAVRDWASTLAATDDLLRWLIQLTIRSGKRTGERLLELVTTHGAQVGAHAAKDAAQAFAEVAAPFAQSVWWTQERAVRGERTTWTSHHLDGATGYHEILELPNGHSVRLEVPLRAFFQPNPKTAERIVATVVDALQTSGPSADLTLVDLYCGTGTMGLALAPYVARVVGVELVEDAVAAARANAAANGLNNATYFAGDCSAVLASDAFRSAIGDTSPDVVLVDPPRAGLQGKAAELTASLAAPRIVYVSCGPKALARDLNVLDEHGYDVAFVQPVDMFPQTHHIENIALLHRRPS